VGKRLFIGGETSFYWWGNVFLLVGKRLFIGLKSLTGGGFATPYKTIKQ
jgi:hypothetical protein